MPKNKNTNSISKLFYHLLFLIAGNIILWSVFIAIKSDNTNQAIFLDVGQGDSLLLKNKQSQQLLIDTGPNQNITTKLNQYLPFYDQKIELVIITHPHDDHYGGLLAIMDNYQIEQLLIGPDANLDPEFKNYLDYASAKNIQIRYAQTKQFINFGQDKITLISPETTSDDDNDHSIIAKIESPTTSILACGDATQIIEKDLITDYPDLLPSQILKISHHGSKTSSSEDFIQKVHPETAIISVGTNKFNHPSPETIQKLQKNDIEIKRTDIQKDIIYDI